MEASQDHWITSAIFEHACKENFKDVTKCILEDMELASKIMQNSVVPPSQSVDPTLQVIEKTKVKPVFLLVSILKQMCSLESFTFQSENVPSLNVLPIVLELLDTTYKQFNFMSLKRYFTLTSELKLLDLLNLIVDNSEPTFVVQKLNQHFPRWSSNYRMALEKDFNIEPQTVVSTVMQQTTTTGTQCAASSATAASSDPMSPNTMKKKCQNFLSTIIRLSGGTTPKTASNVKKLIQNLIDGTIEPEEFSTQLQKELQSNHQPHLSHFLKKSLPHLRQALMTGEITIEGIRPPPLPASEQSIVSTTRNSKVLEKVELSHTQCRRLILKLAADKAYKAKYMSEQYSTDLNRLTKESKAYLMEAVAALESHAGSSVLEKMSSGEELESSNSDDISVQLLLDYIQPEITSDNLLRYLNDFEPVRNSQPASALTSCLLPFDTMSELSEDSDEESDSESESSEDIADSLKPSEDIAPSTKTSKIMMEIDD